jgi:D-sedoheptulose 7-phosphate isomerase
MSSGGHLKKLDALLNCEHQEEDKRDAALPSPVEDRAHQSREMTACFFAAQAPLLVTAARAPAVVYRRDGHRLWMGNGVCDCDAPHVAVECLHLVTIGLDGGMKTTGVVDCCRILPTTSICRVHRCDAAADHMLRDLVHTPRADERATEKTGSAA